MAVTVERPERTCWDDRLVGHKPSIGGVGGHCLFPAVVGSVSGLE